MQTHKPQQLCDAEDNQHADEYVQNFELDQFESFVKREPMRTCRHEHVEILAACSCGQWAHANQFQQSYVAIAVVPSTPPETSPAAIGRSPCYFPSGDDVEGLPYTREPLDMRTVEEWDHREWRHQDHHIQQPGLPSANPSSAMSLRMGHQSYQPPSRGDQLISDYMLLTLSVPELHKRLHGFPRQDVNKLKKKRRTLKNRGYAQDCRSKRLQKRHELELANRSLQDQLHLLRLQLARVTHERHVLNQELALVGREHTAPQHTSHPPITQHSSPEFVSEL